MKKLILFVALLFSLSTYAQTTEREEYCSIEMPSSFYGPKNGLVITVDYGNAAAKKDREELKDKKGRDIKFFSTMQVVNHMSKEGWTLLSVSPTSRKESSALSPSEYSQSLFVFKRKTLVGNED